MASSAKRRDYERAMVIAFVLGGNVPLDGQLESLTAKQLRELAGQLGICLGYQASTKADTVSCIKGYLESWAGAIGSKTRWKPRS